jgi:cytochrome c
MDGFEVNKILGAFLGTCMFTLALSIMAGGIFSPKLPAKPGYDIAVTETPGPGTAIAATQPDVPIAELLAKADAQKGASVAKKCIACHTFEKGGPNKVGPNLWGVIGREKGAVANFTYSSSFKDKMKGAWNFDDLSAYLTNPRKMVPGTSMAFIGLNRPNERADVIAYLNAQSDSPQPLPKAQN